MYLARRLRGTDRAERRRRWSPEEKLALVKKAMESGMTVSYVAREAGIALSQLFQWKKACEQGSLVAIGAVEPVVPASELQDALRKIKWLEAVLGRKTLENEISAVAGCKPPAVSATHY